MMMQDKYIKDLFLDNKDIDDVVDSIPKEKRGESLAQLNDIDKVLSSAKPDYDEMWNIISSRTRPVFYRSNIFRNAVKCAASIIVLLSLGYLGWFIYDDLGSKGSNNIAEVEVVKGKNIPSLILGNGDVVELSNENIGEVFKRGDVSVNNEGNKVLNYIKKSDTLIKPEYNTIVVPRGAEYSVKLSDGTIVNLNAESRLRYPVAFYGNKREVSIEGEGYFRVSNNKEKPFVVNVGDMKVKVLGTIFNVNSYKENDQITTTLVEGSVEVSSKKQSLILSPNQRSLFNGDKIEKKNVDIKKYVSWVNGVFYFEEMTLEDVMIQIERWYDVDVFFTNQALKKKVFTGVIKKDLSIEKLLSIIERVSRIKIRMKGDNIYIQKI